LCTIHWFLAGISSCDAGLLKNSGRFSIFFLVRREVGRTAHMLSAGIKRAYALFGCVTPTRSRSVGEKRFAKRSLLALYNRSVVALTKEGRQTRMEHTGGKSQAQSIITDQASYEFAVTNTLVKAHAFLFRAEQETVRTL
jgi:hypothetical protein